MDNKCFNHYGFWVSPDTAITGVISNNTVEFLNEKIDAGIDIDYENFLKELAGQELTEDEYNDAVEFYENDAATILIGSWIKDNGQYTEDVNGQYAAIVRETVTQVIYSKHTTRAALCSPCYPGQADLNTIGEYLAYTLPADIIGNMNKYND